MPTAENTILVTGDFLWDVNLFELGGPVLPRHADAVGKSSQQVQAGGAWFLRDLLERILEGSPWVVAGGAELPHAASLPRVFQTWRAFPATQGNKKTVWRIDRLMGCSVPEAGSLAAVPLASERNKARMLVIDDLGLGFRGVTARQAELWPPALTNGLLPAEIVVKASLAPDTSPLWRKPLQPSVRERLTVVTTADALRERGAAIPKALSWDQAVEELERELTEGRAGMELVRSRRVVVGFGMEGVAVYESGAKGALEFKRFLLAPESQEGTRKAAYPGRIFGALSILTGAVLQHLVEPGKKPWSLVLARALEAMRASHLRGFGAGDETPNEQVPLAAALSALRPDTSVKGYAEALQAYTTAYPAPDDESEYGFRSPRHESSVHSRDCDLLRDVVGADYEELVAKGIEMVLRGPKQALAGVPCAEYGDYFTVDREEIERINALRGLILNYRQNPNERTPLSLAVFGAPGSGKSFAIKELMKTLVPPGERMEVLTFNLTEFQSEEALSHALHQVRDGSVRGAVPLVFWDEFDTGEFRWLRCFLAPMQDASFTVQGHTHPLGRAIFVFAGGTCNDFNAFQKQAETHRLEKIPDFISRLRGYLNVKGPNPQAGGVAHCQDVSNLAWSDLSAADPAHLIRRANMLWVTLRLCYGHLVERPSVSPDVINGFLRARCFRHGARSVAALVTMSDLAKATRFEASALPPGDLLRLHVSDDFLDHVRRGQLLQPAVEALATAHHASWRAEKEAQGYRWGLERCDMPGKLAHPRLLDYAALKEDWREDNRITARRTQAKLGRLGYEICRRVSGRQGVGQLSSREIQQLTQMEHHIWLRDHLARGWEYAAETEDKLFLHRCIAPMAQVKVEDQRLDLAIANSILPALWAAGYELVRLTPAAVGPQRSRRRTKGNGAPETVRDEPRGSTRHRGKH